MNAAVSPSAPPLVSVCVPAYRHERYVSAAIRSVLAQTWPRIELVVVDDGSPDGTWRVLQSLEPECAAAFERVHFETKPNGGTCTSFNRLRECAHGDFLMFLASDDELLPGALEALIAPMLADGGVGVVAGVNEIMDGDGRRCFWNEGLDIVYDETCATYRTFNEQLARTTGVAWDAPAFGSYDELLRHNHVPNGCLIRAAALARVPPFTRDAPLEDHWLHLQLAKVTRYRGVPQHVFRYRWHAANTIRQRDRMRWFEYLTLAWEERALRTAGDAARLAAFTRTFERVERQCGLSPLFDRRRIRDLHGIRNVTRVFGIPFVTRRREEHPLPPA